jgi:thioredoxin reductase
VEIRTGEKVESISRPNGHFEIRSSRGVYPAHRVVLTIGRRGTPRKLGVPGEELPKVTYKLIDPEQYAGKGVLVVGGGDSAVEAALALAKQAGTQTFLSYRRNAFPRIKDRNRQLLDEAVAAKRISVLLESEVKTIERDRVHLDVAGKPFDFPNDYVIVLIGGELPTEFLQKIGIRTETKFGER